MAFNPKSQLSLIIFSTILAIFSLACIVNFTDPYNSSLLIKIFFYLSLFLASLGLFSILGLFLRQWLWPKLYVLNLRQSFRQALLVAVLVTASFMLLAAGLMFWWLELTLILFLAALEIFMNLKL